MEKLFFFIVFLLPRSTKTGKVKSTTYFLNFKLQLFKVGSYCFLLEGSISAGMTVKMYLFTLISQGSVCPEWGGGQYAPEYPLMHYCY